MKRLILFFLSLVLLHFSGGVGLAFNPNDSSFLLDESKFDTRLLTIRVKPGLRSLPSMFIRHLLGRTDFVISPVFRNENRNENLGSFFYVWVPKAFSREEGARILSELASTPAVENAHFEPKWENATVTAIPVRIEERGAEVPNFESKQFYLDAAPNGVDARYAWQIEGGTGKNIRLVDIETGFLDTHTELKKAFWDNGVNAKTDHGTAVLGEISAKPDGKGVTGISYDVEIGFAGAGFNGNWEEWKTKSLPRAIEDSAKQLVSGEVVIVEQHGPGPDNGKFTAVEYYDVVFEIVKAATDRGVHVVAAAGNGSSNFDEKAYNGAFDLTKRDSGAVLVGAAGAPGAGHLKRLGFSNFGSRVDVCAYGEKVVTSGYGDLHSSSDKTENYTQQFGGTSSATPIVTGVVVSMLGIAKASGESISPKEMRDALRATGTAQKGKVEERIGNLPDLKALVEYFSNRWKS